MFYSDNKKQFSVLNRRTFFLYLLKISLFSIVGWRLYKIQISDSEKYKFLSKNNQIDLEIILPVRGEIYDRNNILLTSNKRVYDLSLIPEKTISIKDTLDNLSEYIDISFADRLKIIEFSKKIKKFHKIKLAENIDWNILEQIESNKFKLPGIAIDEDYIRVYPKHEHFSHILGYINKPNQEDMSLPFVSKMPNLKIGKSGIESTFNSILIGDKCAAHTFPNLDVRNSDSKIEHEATTSKIGDDQLLYCKSRGLSEKDAIAVIVNGFCKDVFKELPMEFAMEAKQLMELTLEDSIG